MSFGGVCCKKLKEGKMSMEHLSLLSLSSYSEQLGDQCYLTSHISFVHSLQLSFSHHVHLSQGNKLEKEYFVSRETPRKIFGEAMHFELFCTTATLTGFMLLRTFVVLAMSRDACALKQVAPRELLVRAPMPQRTYHHG